MSNQFGLQSRWFLRGQKSNDKLLNITKHYSALAWICLKYKVLIDLQKQSFKFHVVVKFLFMHMNMLLFLNKLEEFWETHIKKKKTKTCHLFYLEILQH